MLAATEEPSLPSEPPTAEYIASRGRTARPGKSRPMICKLPQAAPSPAQPTARRGRGGGSRWPRGRDSGTGGRVRGDSDEPMLPVGLVDDVEVDREEDKMPRLPAVETERRPQELPEDVVVCQTPSEASHRDPAGAREEPKEPKHDSEPPEPNQMDDLPDEPDELPPSPGDSHPPPRPDDPSPPPAEAAPAAPALPTAPPAVASGASPGGSRPPPAPRDDNQAPEEETASSPIFSDESTDGGASDERGSSSPDSPTPYPPPPQQPTSTVTPELTAALTALPPLAAGTTLALDSPTDTFEYSRQLEGGRGDFALWEGEFIRRGRRTPVVMKFITQEPRRRDVDFVEGLVDTLEGEVAALQVIDRAINVAIRVPPPCLPIG
ncbi:unnamed protein product [Vitrella brassicaformis CCMP3155]|uniref:Uncharacterized protein n=1 Tax=Vitrella brassicaformis (strain CCMP3155) TaxID=1169540 RepID=A0A0G4ESB6_VITBC|nr:unnamed protein product [Vitrella brassicaformis CCMP3155]|eukprot:CEM00760.1 unnamed protein product [Vitrella brassicaformis CCMP3155]